jgi:hypothetical protein
MTSTAVTLVLIAYSYPAKFPSDKHVFSKVLV